MLLCGTNDEKLKIELLSQWKLEAEFRNIHSGEKSSQTGNLGTHLIENAQRRKVYMLLWHLGFIKVRQRASVCHTNFHKALCLQSV